MGHDGVMISVVIPTLNSAGDLLPCFGWRCRALVIEWSIWAEVDKTWVHWYPLAELDTPWTNDEREVRKDLFEDLFLNP